MRGKTWIITKWTKHITDTGKDEKSKDIRLPIMIHKFRLKDDDGLIYAYGYSTTNDEEEAFEPLDYLGELYGCTSIEYYNNRQWEQL